MNSRLLFKHCVPHCHMVPIDGYQHTTTEPLGGGGRCSLRHGLMLWKGFHHGKRWEACITLFAGSMSERKVGTLQKECIWQHGVGMLGKQARRCFSNKGGDRGVGSTYSLFCDDADSVTNRPQLSASYNSELTNFPGGPVVENPPASAEQSSLPGLGRFHLPKGQLSPWATTTEPVLWSPQATHTEAYTPYSPCSTTREAPAMRSLCTPMKTSPCSLQLEKACMQQQRPRAARN